MVEEYQLRLLPEEAYSEDTIRQYLSQEKGFDVAAIRAVRVVKRSIDARHRRVLVNLKVRAYINELPTEEPFAPTDYPDVSDQPSAIVVGAGPGGLFAALRLIEMGVRPIVLERGKSVEKRKRDLAAIPHTQTIDPESNYCFGEGGAGAFSDGKLYTRSKKRGSVEKILNVFCQHGASAAILADAHPHIGTDRLPLVISNMRKRIIGCGGEVHFQTRMTRLIVQDQSVVGVEAVSRDDEGQQTEHEFRGPVVLATGHSARDVYHYLSSARIEMEAKGIAVGVRLEHPSALIDQIQYHNPAGRGKYLPAAEYSFVTQVDGRGVYSFCMCPGGFVIPAASGPEQLVTNGMSPANRGSKWSNSGMVVQLEPEDIDASVLETENGPLDDALRVMAYQEQLECLCWQQGNYKQTAPAQRMADFVKRRLSFDLPKSSYTPGLISSPLHFWMPSPVSDRLRKAFEVFGRQAHGFLTNEAVMIAVETRTSSPVRILRDNKTLQHVSLRGLYPCGEGAGYAGGIVSAAIDGERCAECLASELFPTRPAEYGKQLEQLLQGDKTLRVG